MRDVRNAAAKLLFEGWHIEGVCGEVRMVTLLRAKQRLVYDKIRRLRLMTGRERLYLGQNRNSHDSKL